MEWRIGEIFEYNGGWYQAVEQTEKSCKACYCYSDEGCFVSTGLGWCRHYSRNDNKSVIFKKLEKIEKSPCKSCYFGMVQLYKLPYWNNGMVEPVGCHFTGDGCVLIEIKQTKEDMEDLNKIKVRDYTKVEELNVMEEKKLNLKPFDLQKAREGKPVCTRGGRKARIICFDRKDNTQIVALIERDNHEEVLQCYFDNGRCCCDVTSDYDLMMLPEKKEGWVNIYNRYSAELTSDGYFYFTKEEALSNIENDGTYVKTIKMSWEE